MSKNLIITNLRVEYKLNPLGIDVLQPRLSWITETLSEGQAGKFQSAYHVIVASSKERLMNVEGDLWDSGKVISSQSNQIIYSGVELKSNQICFWKVKVWDENDNETEWSEVAGWTMGLLSPDEWKAKWITFPITDKDKTEEFSFTAGEDKWIWHRNFKTYGKVYLRKKFSINNLDDIEYAKILISADEKYYLYINSKFAAKCDNKIFSWTRPKLIDVKSFLTGGNNLITVEGINTYLDVPGVTAKLFIIYKDGSFCVIKTDSKWKSSDKEIPGWEQIDFDDSSWEESVVTVIMGDKPWRVPKLNLFLPPPRYFRQEFVLNKAVKYARVHVSALGLYKIYLNGNSITDDRLVPGWTDYNKRVHYLTYDVKEHLQKKNCIGIIAADGWYSGYIGWENHRGYYGSDPQVILQLEIEYQDGTAERIVTDETWKGSFGPIREADLLMGETYDAKLENELTGWDKTGFNSNGWGNVVAKENNSIQLNSHPGNPIRKINEIETKKISSPGPGKYIFDLGQNIAGVVRLKIDGRKSEKIILRFAEMLDENGELYLEHTRMARATDTYYSKGTEEEIWEPSFTYHGFRYIEVTGLNEEPKPEMITGIVLRSDIAETGTFECSNEKLNKLYESILWSQRGNYMEMPTDCPQRDERLGWTADAIDFFNTAAYNMDVSAFYTKWLRDLNDAQRENGAYTAVAPQPDLGVGPLYPGSAGWADAGVVTPYKLYQFYGDIRILEIYYDNMARYLDYQIERSNDYLLPDYGYGDWLSVNAETQKDLISTAYFAYDAKLMMEISLLTGRNEQAKEYGNLFNNIKQAFNGKYVIEGNIIGGTQTAYLLALHFGLLTGEEEESILDLLVNDIQKRDYHISTGFVGLTYLFPILSKYEKYDVIYKLLLNETFPSWLNMINNGATTMWERWDSWTPEKGFFDPLMNSFNHTSLGVIGEWFYSGIGGIIPAEPGFKRAIIKPVIGGGLTYANVSYNSIYGVIKSNWLIKNEEVLFEVTIPFNTAGEVFIPSIINGKKVEDIKFLEKEGNYFHGRITPGTTKIIANLND